MYAFLATGYLKTPVLNFLPKLHRYACKYVDPNNYARLIIASTPIATSKPETQRSKCKSREAADFAVAVAVPELPAGVEAGFPVVDEAVPVAAAVDEAVEDTVAGAV